MYDNFIENGSILAVVLMVFTCHVMLEVGLIEAKGGAHALNELPGIVRSSLGSLLVVAAMPTAFWPAIYIGLFEGVVAGVIAWLVFQPVGLILVRILRVKGPAIGLWFVAASIAMVAGYVLSFMALPA